MLLIRAILISTFAFLANPILANDSKIDFSQISESIKNEKYADAEKVLLTAIDTLSGEGVDLEVKANLYFALGRSRYFLAKLDQAESDLKVALDLNGSFNDYVYHYLGLVNSAQKQTKQANQYFQSVVNFKPQSYLRLDANFELAKIAMNENEWTKARRILRYLERKKRRDENYPEILASLIETELHKNNQWQACRWVKKLYRSFPLAKETKDWNPRLEKQSFGKFQPRCQASQSDKKARVKKLLWSGKMEQAIQEIEFLRLDGLDSYSVDLLLVGYYNHKGEIEQSLKVLQKYYDAKQWNVDYLNLLASTSAKMGRFPQAVGLYYKVYKLQGRSTNARQSLYRAAFLSYQFQDYDGAARKFDEFVSKYSRSGLARDAQWHLAWIQYLKGDFAGAYAKLEYIWKKRRIYRRSRSISDDKITYWMAMSLYRMGEKEKAKVEFMKLASLNHFTFYTLSARARVLDLVGSQGIRNISSLDYDNFEGSLTAHLEDLETSPVVDSGTSGLASDPEQQEDEISVLQETNQDLEKEEEIQAKKEEAEELEKEKQSTKLKSVFNSSGSFGVATKDSELNDKVSIEEERTEVTSFRHPLMNQRFKRATNLIQMGMYDLARWELYDIEKRTSNRTYLKTLMEAYQRIGAYHRSSYLGEVYFSSERAKYGIKGARYLWDYTYPQAYPNIVEKYSSEYGVPSEFTWGIMRQESNFRTEISSPVGARGLMQLMPFTAQKVSDITGAKFETNTDLYTADLNVQLGTGYLKRLMKKFDGKFPLVAAAYNAGPHRVDAWLQTFGHLDMDEFVEHIPFVETRNYVKKVTQNFHVYELLRNQSSFELDIIALSKPVGLTFVGKLPTKENWN